MLDFTYIRFGLSFLVSAIFWPVTYLGFWTQVWFNREELYHPFWRHVCKLWGTHLWLIAWLLAFVLIAPHFGVVLP